MSECWIVGSGPNTTQVPDGVDVIAVNEEMGRFLKAKYFLTLDYAWYAGKKLDFNGIKVFILCLHDYVKDGVLVRDTRIDLDYDLSEFDWIIKSRVKNGVSRSMKDFRNNGNSGLSAFQFALCLGYKTIHLCGIEMRGDYAPFLEFMKDDLRRFEDIFPEVTVVNHCKTSNLVEFFGYE